MIKTKLMNHQKLMVDFACTGDKKYVGLFADYGVGKTLTALAIMHCLNFRKILVVSTKTSIEATWPSEVRDHTDFKFYSLLGSRKQKIRTLKLGLRVCHIDAGYYHKGKFDPVIFLINFDGVKNCLDVLRNCYFDAIFLDESTKIKDPKTVRTKAIWYLGKFAYFKCIMTGFPITEGLHEIYSQVKFLDGGKTFGSSYRHFLHLNFVKMGNLISPKLKSIPGIMESISPFCIRVTNKHLKLPPKIYKVVELKKTKQQQAALTELHQMMKLELGRVKVDTPYILSLIAKSLQICDGFLMDENKEVELIPTNKDEALIESLDEIQYKKNKIIIWAYHRFTVFKIYNVLKALKYPVIELSGDSKNINQIKTQFQTDPKTRILVASIKKAAESITLTQAKYALYYGHHWSNDNRNNSEARLRRKGSEIHDSICYIDFVTRGTTEKNVSTCLKRKSSLVSDLKKHFEKLKNSQLKDLGEVA